ncbi:MAG: transcriptional regulator GcvA [Pseudomonadota bacterium]
MPDRLPPLTALRAFDAAARHMSFAKAAEELHVTPAALSYQIKSLEEHLGTPVFRRLNRAVELTEAGRQLAPGIAEGFRTLAGAWRAAQRLQDNATLTVTAGPAFTAKWLAPRLFDFAQAHPEIELRFAASLRMVDLTRDGVDVAIRFGYGPDDGLYSLPLAEEWVSPVMTPEMAARFPTPESLIDAPIIFDTSISFLKPAPDWTAWFQLYGIAHTPTQGPIFSQADHALDAVQSGLGVALGRRAFVVKDIMDGRLVAPFPKALGTGARFRFICQNGAEERPQIAAFREWVLAEIDKGRHVTDAMEIVPVADLSAG